MLFRSGCARAFARPAARARVKHGVHSRPEGAPEKGRMRGGHACQCGRACQRGVGLLPARGEWEWGLTGRRGRACPRERAARARRGNVPKRRRAGAVAGRGGRGARQRRRGETRREGEGSKGARGRAGARGHMGEGRREGAREGGRRMGGLKPRRAEEPVQSGRRRRQWRRRLQPARRGVRQWDPAAVLAPRSCLAPRLQRPKGAARSPGGPRAR